jgi:hypothetical protein
MQLSSLVCLAMYELNCQTVNAIPTVCFSLSLQRSVRALLYIDTIARVKMWDRVREE